MKKFLYDEKYAAWLFLAPALIGTLVFIIIPICASFYISLLDWDLIGLPKFVGFNNYLDLFQ